MKDKKDKRHGIILAATMVFMTVLTMLIIVMAQAARNTFMGGVGYQNTQQAYMAAMSGIDYAMGELRQNRYWGVGGCGLVSRQDDNVGIKVAAESNSVTGSIGLIDGSGYKAEFIIDFVGNSKTCKYKSVNNFNGANGTSEIDIGEGVMRTVPANYCYIVSKGVCGKSVKYVAAFLSLDGASALKGGSVVNGSMDVGAAPSTGHGDRNTKEPFMFIQHADGISPGNLVVTDILNLNGPGSVISDFLAIKENEMTISTSGITLNGSEDAITFDDLEEDEKKLSINTPPPDVENDEDLNSINTFEKVKATITTEQPENIVPSGTYVFMRSKEYIKSSEGKILEAWTSGKWMHSDTAYNEKAANLDEIVTSLDDIDSTQSISFGLNGDESLRRVQLNGNVSSDGPLSFVAVDRTLEGNRKYIAESQEWVRSSVSYKLSESTIDFSVVENDKDHPTCLKINGDLHIEGEITGTGNVFVNGAINMHAGSYFETKPQSGIAIWAKDDIAVTESDSLSLESQEMSNYILALAKQAAMSTSLPSDGSLICCGASGNLYAEDIVPEAVLNANQVNSSDGITIPAGKNCSTPITVRIINSDGKNVLAIYKRKTEADGISKDVFVRCIAPGSFQKAFDFVSPQGDIKAIKGEGIGTISTYNINTVSSLNSSCLESYRRGRFDDDGERISDPVLIRDFSVGDTSILLRNHIRNLEIQNPDVSSYPGSMELIIDGCIVGVVDVNDGYDSGYRGHNQSRYPEGINPFDRYASTGGILGTDYICQNGSEHTRGILFAALRDHVGPLSALTKPDSEGWLYPPNYIQLYEPFGGISLSNPIDYKPFEHSLIKDITASTGGSQINSIEDFIRNYYRNNVANTFFKGTVYTADGGMTINTDGFNFDVLGALIVMGGGLNGTNLHRMKLIYDPNYVPFFKETGVSTRAVYKFAI